MIEEQKTIKEIDAVENLLRQGKYREAIVLCEEIHRAYPEEESVLLILSWAYYDSGDTKKALEHLHTLLERELKRKVFTGFAFDTVFPTFTFLAARAFSKLAPKSIPEAISFLLAA